MPQETFNVTATTQATAQNFPFGGFLRTGLLRAVASAGTSVVWVSFDNKNFFPMLYYEYLSMKAEDTSRVSNAKVCADKIWAYVSAGTANLYWLGTVY